MPDVRVDRVAPQTTGFVGCAVCGAAGAAAYASFEETVNVRFAGRRKSDLGADLAGLLRSHGHSSVEFTVVGSGPNGASHDHLLSERTI